MDIIKERNNVEPVIYAVLILFIGCHIYLYFATQPTFFYFSCIITSLICIFLYFRTIKISIDRNSLKIKLLFFFIPYKTINVEFDTAKHSHLDTITFYKNQVEISSLTYQDDMDESSYELGWLQIRLGAKRFEFGNRKRSYELFKKIKQSLSKYNSLTDT